MIRITIDMSPELGGKLDSLAKEMSDTKSGVLRRALALMFVAVEARKDGMRLVVVDDDGKVDKEIIGLW